MRTTITAEYKMLKAEREAATWPTPSVMPEQFLMDYTEKHGRKEGLLLNNRMHVAGIDGTLRFTNEDQYNVNRDWILANFKK